MLGAGLLLRCRAVGGKGVVNGRKLSSIFGLLRNSTIFRCAKNSGLEQCSQKAPENAGKLKQRPDCSHRPCHQQPSHRVWFRGLRSQVSGLSLWPRPLWTCSVVGLWRRGCRKNQATLCGIDNPGAFCEHCSSPNFLRSKKWSSCAAAGVVDGAVAFSAAPADAGRLSRIEVFLDVYASSFLTSFSIAAGLSVGA